VFQDLSFAFEALVLMGKIWYQQNLVTSNDDTSSYLYRPLEKYGILNPIPVASNTRNRILVDRRFFW
jgi:hypothetical protein